MSEHEDLISIAIAVVLVRAQWDAGAPAGAWAALSGIPSVHHDIVRLRRGLDAIDADRGVIATCAAAEVNSTALAAAVAGARYAPPSAALIDALGGYLDDDTHRRVVWALDGACSGAPVTTASGMPAW